MMQPLRRANRNLQLSLLPGSARLLIRLLTLSRQLQHRKGGAWHANEDRTIIDGNRSNPFSLQTVNPVLMHFGWELTELFTKDPGKVRQIVVTYPH
jgi:hypothetical protein